MALLYRVARLRDRADTHVFTFVVTRSVTRDPERDVTSKELSCGHHKWAITFSRADSALGVYLVWRSACEGMRVYVDFTFTLLNRDHFSTNEGFSGKQVKFTTETPAQGSRRCILLSELAARGFADARGEFQLELCVGALRTVFAADVRLPHTPVVVHAAAGTHHHHHSRSREGSAGSRLESAYFSFGGFDWNLALVPQPKDATGEPSVGIQLNRLSGLTHAVRARFVCALGDAAAPRRADSGPVDALADADGRAPVAWSARGTLNEYAHKGSVRVVIELLSVRALCEVSVALGASGPPLAAGAPPPPAAQLYDRDKQAWAIRSDCHSETVRLHMVYKDIHNVPRNHLRYMSWSASVVRVRGPGANTAVTRVLPGAPYSHYYAQDSSDEGIIMETDLAVKEVRDPSCPFLSEATGGGAGGLRVQVEWGDSYLLFQATYHAYDDVCRVHNHQMKREIAALQAENYSLERQLFSYQKSMAYTHARGGYSDEPVTPDGHVDDEDVYYGDERAYSLGERSLSTDTEYA